MSHRRASSSLGCFLLLVLVPLCASAAPKDPCRLLQRDLDQQIDDLKAWQKLDLQECNKVSGSVSDACRQLQDQHAQDLRAFRDNRAFQMANCHGPRSRSLAAASPFEVSNNDFYEKYYRNRGPCVEYPYVNCEHYDHYVHAKYHHHHHHEYTASSSGSGKPASAPPSAYVEKPSTKGVQGNTDKNLKPDAAATRSSAHDTSAQSGHRGSDHDNSASRSSGHDNSSSHGSGRSDASATASSHHSHDSGGASNSGGSHASGGSDFHGSSSSAGSSSSGASHSSGGGGSSSGSSSSPASSSGSTSSVSSGASASSPASSPSHDSGGSRPK
jgi:hypothetical protein